MAGALTADGLPAGDPVALMETELFAEAAYRQYGVDLRGFDRQWLLGRLSAFRQRAALESISALQGVMLRDPSLARAVFSFVNENAAAFFTRPSSFMALRCAVLPLLRSVTWPVLWIAECADPAFLIQLVVMLDEEALLPRTQLFVTNANEDVLSRVAALRLAAPVVAAYEELHLLGGGRAPLREYCEADDSGLVLKDRLRPHLVWSQHDLAADASFNECHLVVCQRPLAEFDPALRKRALGLFSESLCNFGILQLDAAALPASHELMRDFTCLLGEQGIYKRLPVEPRPPPLAPAALQRVEG